MEECKGFRGVEQATLTETRWWGSGMAAVAGIAAATVVVHLATGWRYGFDRDELMALEDARHLAWGYVQYPPMTAFLGRVALELFGTSLVGFRFFSALAQALALVLTGLMAKEMGGGKWAQVTAALAGVPFCLGAGELMQYITFDYVCWAWVAYAVVKVAVASEGKSEEAEECNGVRVQEWLDGGNRNLKMENREGRQKSRLEAGATQSEVLSKESRSLAALGMTQGSGGGTQDAESGRARSSLIKQDAAAEILRAQTARPRDDSGFYVGRILKAAQRSLRRTEGWWVAVGVGVGLGMMAKYTMLFLVCGLMVGVVATPMRKYLRSAWLWLGMLMALGIFAPNFIWQWRHGFVSLEFLRFLHARDVRTGVTDWFLLGQLELTLLAAPLALAGLVFCFFTDAERRWRVIGWMYVVPLALFLVMQGRDYYLAPAYPMLYAAGSVWVERKLRGKKEVSGGEWRVASEEKDPKKEVQEWQSAKVEEEQRDDNAETQSALRFAEKAEDSVRLGVESESGKLAIENRKSEERSGILAPQNALGMRAFANDGFETSITQRGRTGPTNLRREDRADMGRSMLHPYTEWVRRGIWVCLILDVVVAAAVAVPLAPVGSRWWKFAAGVDTVFPEEIGWPEFVQAVAAVRDRLPEEERGRVTILAGNYGEMGALNLYGEKFGLPRAISGVNSSWERGYGESGDVVIVVGYSREFLEEQFASCAVGGRVWNRYGVMNEETVEDPEIFVCRGLKGGWDEFWKRVRKFA